MDIEKARYALKATETMEGISFNGNNHKIGQLFSLHGHLNDALSLITEQQACIVQLRYELQEKESQNERLDAIEAFLSI